jgi:hypothetical protein
MSDEKTAMVGALETLLGPKALRLWHGAIVVDQADDGSVGVKLPGAAAPSATAKPVPLLLGLPCFAARLKPGTEVSVAFHEGSEGGAFAALFPYFPQSTPEVPLELPAYSVSFGGGSRPISRVDDSVNCGSIIISNLPPAPGPVPTGVQIVRQLVDGTQLILGTLLGLVTVVPSPLTITLTGVITSGREEFTA